MRIAISGTPGTGKHTIARALGEALQFQVTDLGTLAKEHGLTRKDEKRDTLVVDIEKLKKFLPKDGIVVSNYAELFSADIVIVIRCHPEVLAGRLAARKYKPEKIKENLMAECLDICLASAIKKHKKIGEVNNSSELQNAVDKTIEIVKNNKLERANVDFSEFADKVDELTETAINNSNL